MGGTAVVIYILGPVPIVLIVSLGRLFDDSHVLLAVDCSVESPFEFAMQQKVAKRIIRQSIHAIGTGRLQNVVDEVALLKDLQNDLRRTARNGGLGSLVQQIHSDRVRGFVVSQLRVVLLLTEHDQIPTMGTRRRVVVFSMVGGCL